MVVRVTVVYLDRVEVARYIHVTVVRLMIVMVVVVVTWLLAREVSEFADHLCDFQGFSSSTTRLSSRTLTEHPRLSSLDPVMLVIFRSQV